MPLLVYAVAAWLIGLFAATIWGEHSTPIATIITGALCLAISAILGAITNRGHTLSASMAVAIAGFLTGSIAAQNKAACRTAMANNNVALSIALDARAKPGAFVRGEAIGQTQIGECRLNATLKVREGFAPPGNIVQFSGTRLVTERGLKLEGDVQRGSHQSLLRAWRGRAGESLDTLFGSRTALARALLIADQDGIDPSVRDRFADAGLIHILSISGLHVALIAGALTVIASAMRLPRAPAAFVSLFLVLLYVLALGAPPPAVRSAIMLATGTLVARLQRPVHPWTALALGAVVPTWRPDVVLDLGWQLSVSGMASLVAARAIMSRVRHSSPAMPKPRDSVARKRFQRVQIAIVAWLKRLDGWRWTLTRELFTGTIATIVTAPIVSWYFGRISIIAPLSNIAASPVIAFLQPALFLALVLAPWHAVAKLAADACIAPLAMLDAIAARSASVPHAALHIAPTMVGAAALGIATATIVRAPAARRPARYVIVAIGAVCVAMWWPTFSRDSGEVELHMMDVGQGDAIAIRTPKGRWILLDAGRSWNGGDAGRRVVVPYVRRLGGEIAAFILSHPHDDHVGGAASVVQALHPATWWEPAYVGTSPTYRSALVAVQAQHIPWHRAHPGDTLRIDGVLIRALAPDSMWTLAQTDPNLASVVVAVEYKNVRWLFTGDAEIEEEEWLVNRWGSALQSSVLKAGHHGSKTSSSGVFLDAVQPSVALVSVGADNTYGHPSPSVMAEFERRGIQVLRTDRDGPIVVRTDGVRQQIETRAGKWNVPTR
ncbi:MAG: DNA internalization-related competence protein ComEC/Rec2 [Gemmatimonadaceae bacterium]